MLTARTKTIERDCASLFAREFSLFAREFSLFAREFSLQIYMELTGLVLPEVLIGTRLKISICSITNNPFAGKC